MNNEPVAWKITNKKTSWLAFDQSVAKEPDEVAIPLYTHPAKTLTVTFEDCIAASLEQNVGYGGDLDLFEFARAILRKAQER